MNIKEVYRIAFPPEKQAIERLSFFEYYFVRPLSVLMTLPLINTKITPTAITKLSVLCCFAGFFLTAFGTTMMMKTAGWFFFLLWCILDSVDGNLARVTNQCSVLGGVWDAIGGYLAVVLIFFSTGITAFYDDNIVYILPAHFYIIIGSASAIGSIFHRLIYNRMLAGGLSPKITDEYQNNNLTLIKWIRANFINFSGFFMVIMLLSILFHVVNLFVIVYFCYTMIEVFFSMYRMLKNVEKQN